MIQHKSPSLKEQTITSKKLRVVLPRQSLWKNRAHKLCISYRIMTFYFFPILYSNLLRGCVGVIWWRACVPHVKLGIFGIGAYESFDEKCVCDDDDDDDDRGIIIA